jgi:hypothetical protein
MSSDTISKSKLISFLRSARSDTHDLEESDPRCLYSRGRNILADLVLVGIATGDFDMEEKE